MIEEGAERARRIDLFKDLPAWTPANTGGPNFMVALDVDEIVKGERSGGPLNLYLNSDIHRIVVSKVR